jgi:hypothetical protein
MGLVDVGVVVATAETEADKPLTLVTVTFGVPGV